MQFQGMQPTVDLTYSDVFLIPRRSEVGSRLSVDLSPGDGTPATIPIVAANMTSVTGPRLAASLARRGGLAVLPQDLSLDELAAGIRRVKAQPVLCDSPLLLPAEATAAEALRLVPPLAGHGVVVLAGGGSAEARAERPVVRSDVIGLLSASRLAAVPTDARLGDLVQDETPGIGIGRLGAGRESFEAVRAACEASGSEILAVWEGDRLLGTITATTALRTVLYGPAVDASGRLAVAAAIGISRDAAGAARALAAAGADVIVLDTAHGHQDSMLRAVDAVASLDLGVPLVAGNVVTSDGVHDLVDAGADIVKVGVGPGAMCTTRMMTAVGRPQFSAVLETAVAARELGAHVWADGGVRYPRDVALALAAGAASVMVGSWFAGTVEAPGELAEDEAGRRYKESWGMASTKAVHARFHGLDDYERARKELFAEGISSSRVFLDPDRPGVEDLVDMITSGVRSAFTYAGSATLSEFHGRALVGLQSAAGYDEGKPRAVSGLG